MSFAEKKEWVEKTLDNIDSLAKRGKTYPMLESVEASAKHQELLINSKTIRQYVLKMPARESGFRHGFGVIDVDSDFYAQIKSLAKGSLTRMMETLRLLDKVRKENVDKIKIRKRNNPTLPYWGQVYHKGKAILEFRRILVGENYGVVFQAKDEDKEMPWKAIIFEADIPPEIDQEEAISLIATEKLINQLHKEDFFRE